MIFFIIYRTYIKDSCAGSIKKNNDLFFFPVLFRRAPKLVLSQLVPPTRGVLCMGKTGPVSSHKTGDQPVPPGYMTIRVFADYLIQ
jgi:hypothetical protein